MKWFAAINFNGDGSTFTDITQYVQKCQIDVGSKDPIKRTPKAGKFTLTLKNVDKRFSPANAAGAYYPNLVPKRLVRIQRQYPSDGSSVTIFLGIIDNITPTSGRLPASCTIDGSDYLAAIQKHKIAAPLQINQSSDFLVKTIVNYALRAPAGTMNIPFTTNPANNDWIQFVNPNTGNTVRYTFKTSIASAGDVLVGSTYRASIANLVAAINGAEGANTLYTPATLSPGVSAAPLADYYDVVIADAPHRYYRLDDTNATTVNFGLDGIAGATYNGGYTQSQTGALSGDSDTATLFNGTTGYVNCPPALEMVNAAFSIECWVKETTPGTFYDFLGLYSPANGEYFVLRIVSTGQLQIQSNHGVLGSSSNIPSNTGTHILVTMSTAGAVTIYLNGAAAGISSPVLLIAAGSIIDLTLAKSTVSGAFFAGTLDEVAIYGYALTAAQALAHYNAAAQNPGVALTALLPGTVGNSIAVTKSSSAFTLPGGTLTGGADYPAGLMAYDTGVHSFDIVGDNWDGKSVDALKAITDVVQSEYGRFWQRFDGSLVFKNQDYSFKEVAVATSINLNGQPVDITGDMRSDAVYNRIQVTLHPRAVLTAATKVAQANAVIQVAGLGGTAAWNGTVVLPGGGVNTIRLAFTDPATGKAMGAQNIILPLVPGTDYKVNERKDFTGFDYTNASQITVSAIVSGGGVILTIKNTALGPLYIGGPNAPADGIQVRGQGLTSYAPVISTAEDAASELTYGIQDFVFDLPYGSDKNYSDSLAAYLLSKLKSAFFWVRKIKFVGKDTIGAVGLLTLDQGTTLALTESQWGLTNIKYEIIGLTYTLIPGPNPLADWSADVARLDDVTYGIWDDATYGIWDSTFRWEI